MRERQVKNVTSNRDNTTRRTHAEDIPRGWKRENSGSWSANGNRSRRKASVRKLLVDFPYPPTYLEVTYPLATLPSPLPTLSLSLSVISSFFSVFSSRLLLPGKSRSQAEKPIVRCSLDFSDFFITGCSSLWRSVYCMHNVYVCVQLV